MHKVILCLEAGKIPRNSIPKIIGRSGRHYANAYFNGNTMQHESDPIDVELWNSSARQDLAKVNGLLPWLPEVRLGDENTELKRLTDENHELRAQVAMLEAQIAKAPATPFDALTELPAEPQDEFSAMTVRELRQACKDRGIAIPHNSTRPQLLDLLKAPAPSPAPAEQAQA